MTATVAAVIKCHDLPSPVVTSRIADGKLRRQARPSQCTGGGNMRCAVSVPMAAEQLDRGMVSFGPPR